MRGKRRGAQCKPEFVVKHTTLTDRKHAQCSALGPPGRLNMPIMGPELLGFLAILLARDVATISVVGGCILN
jgi:hypothetical protein